MDTDAILSFKAPSRDGARVTCGPSLENEAKIKNETKATVRLVLMDSTGRGRCIYTGEETDAEVLFAQAY
jgi:hypothetical protein